VVTLHADDAEALHLTDGLDVDVDCNGRLVPAKLRLFRDMARGVVVLPRLPDFAGAPVSLGPSGLRRR